MSYLDGVNFGTDQISPYEQIPFYTDLAVSSDDGPARTVLAARDVYPRVQSTETTTLPALSERGVVRVLTDPTIAHTPVLIDNRLKKERFHAGHEVGHAGRTGHAKFNIDDNIHMILLFLLVMIIIIQVRMLTTMDVLLRCRNERLESVKNVESIITPAGL